MTKNAGILDRPASEHALSLPLTTRKPPYTMNAPLTTSAASAELDVGAPSATWNYVVNGKTAYTEDGLVVKNVDKIDAVNSRLESRIVAKFHSWQISRDVRRDFHILTSKIFKRSRDRIFMAQVRDLISEIVVQGEFLKEVACHYSLPEGAVPQEVPLRIVSPEAGTLYRVFSHVDIHIAALTHASRETDLQYEQVEEMIRPFMQAYKDLKGYIAGKQQQSDQTAAEIGHQSGIA